MAPIPEDNQEKPPPRDDEEINAFSNGNLAAIDIDSDSSDENDDNYPDTAGYVLLPQEPGGEDDDDDSENDEGDESNSAHTLESRIDGTDSVIPDCLPDEVIQSEGGAVAPTVTASSTSLHPEFLAKFPDGKVPSYMQVPAIPSNSKDVLWNRKRIEKSSSLDTDEEKKVMKAMSGFSLPLENVPDWARNMSEDQWHNVISQQIGPSQQQSDNSCQKDQKEADSSSVAQVQKQEDWVAEFPDS